MKKPLVIVLLLMALILPQAAVWADGSFSLTLYAVMNEDHSSPNFTYDPTKGLPESFSSRRLIPLPGEEVALYRVDPVSRLEVLDARSLRELGDPIARGTTDAEGKIVFQHLSQGTYYLRHGKGQMKAKNVLITIPGKDSPETKDYTVYLKGEKPHEPERSFKKVDENLRPLAGARFKVLRRLGTGQYSPVLVDGKELIVTSDGSGAFRVSLPKGEYALVETVSPVVGGVKYKLLSAPVRFRIDEGSFREEPIVIQNLPGEEVPPPNTPPGTPPTPPQTPPTPPETPPDTPPETPPTPPQTPPTPPNAPPTPGIHIPKTGDIEIFLMTFGGLILFGIGLWYYRKERIGS